MAPKVFSKSPNDVTGSFRPSFPPFFAPFFPPPPGFEPTLLNSTFRLLSVSDAIPLSPPSTHVKRGQNLGF